MFFFNSYLKFKNSVAVLWNIFEYTFLEIFQAVEV